jgi:hypothetical protein
MQYIFTTILGKMPSNVPAVYDVLLAPIRTCEARPGLVEVAVGMKRNDLAVVEASRL